MESRAELESHALELGFDLVGVCPVRTPPHLDAYREWVGKGRHAEMDYLEQHLPLKADPRNLLPEARSIIAVALNYNQPNPELPGQPRIARYALGRDYHRVMRGKLRRLAGWLEGVYPQSIHRACVDSAPIMERDFGQLAGLGWFGKNTMLINSKRGSWFFIGLLLTSVEFQPSDPAIGGCGTCRACIDACPTGAIIYDQDRWQVDARRCISYLTIEHTGPIESELAEDMGRWTFGCDVCQEVCPFNEARSRQPLRAAPTREPDFLAKRSWPNLIHLAQLPHEEWDVMTQGSATRRAGPEQWKRNALIALSNYEAAAETDSCESDSARR